MSNIINNNLLSNETTSNTGTTTNPTSDQNIKDKPSLFDSLLIAPTTEEKVEVVGDKKEQKVEIVTTEVKEEDNKEKIVGNSASSLLDRLVIEAKKEVKDISKEELNNKVDSLLIVPTTEEKVEVVGDKKEQKIEILNSVSSLNSGLTPLLSDGEESPNLIPTDENMTVVGPIIIPEENKETEITIKKDQQSSLMDKLIQKNSETITLETINSNIDTPSKEVVAKDLISSIYLGSQKNQANNQSLFNKNEAVTLLKDGSSIQAVKTSAGILELGLENIEVEQIAEVEKLDIKKSNIDIVDRKNLIDTILSQKNIKSEEVKNLITKSVDASNALIENTINLTQDVTVNVNSPIAYNIQSRIIGAKQQMSAMMSDIAKQMYENYKPPVTAFKINLNPLDLGSIAILMKTDKNNGLTISLSISNNTTLEALIENQNVLRTSLNKTFDENTKFNLDFNSSNQNSDNPSSNNQNGQGSNRKFEQQMDTQSILQMKDENKDKEEKVIDYM